MNQSEQAFAFSTFAYTAEQLRQLQEIYALNGKSMSAVLSMAGSIFPNATLEDAVHIAYLLEHKEPGDLKTIEALKARNQLLETKITQVAAVLNIKDPYERASAACRLNE